MIFSLKPHYCYTPLLPLPALGTAKGVAIVSAPPRTVVAMLEDVANKKKEA